MSACQQSTNTVSLWECSAGRACGVLQLLGSVYVYATMHRTSPAFVVVARAGGLAGTFL